MVDYDSNAAYDLSLFAPAVPPGVPAKKDLKVPTKPAEVKKARKSKKELRLQKQKRQQKIRRVLSICVVLLFCGGLRLQSMVEISGLAKQMEQEIALLETAQSESVRLATQVETEYSFAKVQDYIKDKGMQKTQSHQRFDFNASRTDKVTNYLGMPII
ncbi:MAG TPA: hypothetical protein VFD23_02905 [Clostridia bacterium]|nr:hypothetical protein [Clostridia bacterium]